LGFQRRGDRLRLLLLLLELLPCLFFFFFFFSFSLRSLLPDDFRPPFLSLFSVFAVAAAAAAARQGQLHGRNLAHEAHHVLVGGREAQSSCGRWGYHCSCSSWGSRDRSLAGIQHCSSHCLCRSCRNN